MKRRFLSLVLMLAMVIGITDSMMPQAAAAPSTWDGTVDVSWFDPAESEFYIGTPAQLAGLAALVNGMTDPNCPQIIGDKTYIKSVAFPDTMLVGAGGGNVSDTVYGSEIDFAYKTVYLTADLDMGGVYTGGKWSGPNWTPIGGKFPMKPEVTKGDCFVLDTRFNGVFDGQGHTVNNIYCDRYADKGFPYSMAVGLVGFLGGAGDNDTLITGTFKDGWQPSVRNVIVGKGYIYARRMVGGVVGRVGTTSDGVIIENCANFAEVHNTDSKGIGGIVGAGWGDGAIRNCYNAGSVTTTYVCPAGGICGNNSGMDIYNCYNVGRIDSNNQKRGRGIGGHDSGEYSVLNCYYLEGCDDDPESGGWYTGNSKRITVDVKLLSAERMKTRDFIDMLNASGAVFVADSANINGGYPILCFQAAGYKASGSYSVTLSQPASGGTISSDLTGTVAAGKTVTLTADAAAGWTLKYFTLNGKPLDSDFFVVSADSTASAVFSEVKQVKVTLPLLEDSYLSITKTGFELQGGKMAYVTDKPVNSGDTLLEENVVTVNAVPYDGVPHADVNTEYTGSYAIAATNTIQNTGGTFTVTGAGDITFTVTQNTGKKSWLSIADTSWYTGDGDTYTLTTAAQLAGMAKLVNVEGVDFKGITICLGNDISLLNTGEGTRIWEACGKNMSRCFSGTFDGRGYTIYDMTAYNAGSYAGLFGYCVGATIKNVTVRGTVTGQSDTAYAAGIVSYASGCTIENCVNRAVINASGTGAAGIAAYICDGSTVESCTNRAAVSGTSGIGGIVGICYSTDDTIDSCQNYGEINASSDSSYGTGGVVGQLAGLMSNCGNFGAVTSADRYTGGLAGYTTARIYSRIENCVSNGAVTSSCANQSAAVGSAVGYAQYLTLENVSATGTVSVGSGYKSLSKGGLIGREGTVAKAGSDDASKLPKSVTDTDIWTPSTHQSGDGSQTASADKPVFVRGGDKIIKNGVYLLDPWASGEIAVADGLAVTLTGIDTCGELSVNAGNNVALTLQNVKLHGEKTLLTLSGGTLTLVGKNELINTSDVKENQNPTISISGGGTVSGQGSLLVYADIGNSAVKLSAGASLELKNGTLSLRKDGLLGEIGGALYANEATVIISGGVFTGYTNSDNVSVISAQTLKVTGGIVRAQADKSPAALEGGTVTISGGTLYCAGHTGNSAGIQKAYLGEEAITGLSGSAACTFEKQLPFTDVVVTDEYFSAVRSVYNMGYFSGTSTTEYSPDTGMTRAMFVTVLYRMAGSPAVTSAAAFTDLTQSWYMDAVAWAVTSGITEGSSKTTFSPNSGVTIEQAAVFLRRYQQLMGKSATPVNGDYGAGSSPWARAAAVWSVENGILPTGCDFKADASRAALASAISALTDK